MKTEKSLKGYYPFYMFGKLYRLGVAAASLSDDADVYALGAVGVWQECVESDTVTVSLTLPLYTSYLVETEDI